MAKISDKQYKRRKKKLAKNPNRKMTLRERIERKGNTESKNLAVTMLEEVDKMLVTCKNSKKDLENIPAVHPSDTTTKLQLGVAIDHITGKLTNIRNDIDSMKDDIGKDNFQAIDNFLKICDDLQDILNNDLRQIATIIQHLKNGEHVTLKIDETLIAQEKELKEKDKNEVTEDGKTNNV